jgi:CBS domain containing-hemolysin-like protein
MGSQAVPVMDPIIGLLVAVTLVFVNGFFVAAEFALVKVRPTQIDPLAERGDRRARAASHLIRHLDAYLSATQLGITLASLGLGWIGEPAFTWVVEPLVSLIPGASRDTVHSVALTMSFVTITALHIVLGELAPKSLAIRKPEASALWIALPMVLFYRLTYPAIWLLNHAALGLLKLIGIAPASEADLAHTEEELRRLLSSGGTVPLGDQKRELLDNVFELSHRTARQVMVPRGDVVYLSLARSLEENLQIAKRSGHTRFPLCKEHMDDLIGMLHIKDLFRRASLPRSLEDIMRPIQFVPETLTLDRLLRRMRNERLQFCAVVDEYGGVSGVVTMENVVEELVGDIRDEFDAEEKPELTKKSDDIYWVSGGMLVMDLERALGIEFSERDEDRIAGVVLSELGRPPKVGDRVRLGPLELEVLEVAHRTIKQLRLTIHGPEDAGESPDG